MMESRPDIIAGRLNDWVLFVEMLIDGELLVPFVAAKRTEKRTPFRSKL